MADSTDTPFWLKVISWAKSFVGAVSKQAAIRRDASLKKFAGKYVWVDGEWEIVITVDRIIAENEQEARQLATAQAAKDHPIVSLLLAGKDVVPPYVKDPNAVLAQWKIMEMPLNDADRELAKVGELGPPHASGAGKASALANPAPA